jgi:hypothetical protein
MSISKPEASEFGSYYDQYVAQVQGDDIVSILKAQADAVLGLLASISEEQSTHRYAPDKWSIRELVGHLIDTERVFVYRAFRFSRNDETPLHGYDHDKYIQVANYDARFLRDIAGELNTVRAATLAFFNGLSDEMLLRRGVANNNPFSVRAMAWIIAGHTEHHLSMLKEKYL